MSVNLVDMAQEYQSDRPRAPRPQGPLRAVLVRASLARVLETGLGVLDGLVAEGFEVAVIAPEDTSPAPLELRGIDYVRVPQVRWTNPASWLAAFVIMQGHMLERTPTLVHARDSGILWPAALAAARAEAGALVVTVEDHGSLLGAPSAPFPALSGPLEVLHQRRELAYRWLGELADAYIVASPTELKVLHDAEIVPGPNLHVMPGLDGVEVPSVPPPGPTQGPLRLGVVTDGSRAATSERARLMRGLLHMRWFELDALGASMPTLDALVVLRRTQGIEPRVLEALANGIPCVAYRTPGSASLIEDGRSGWLVEGDVAAVVRDLEREACARRGVQAHQEARRRFPRGRAQSQVLELYARALERKFT